MMIGIQTSIRSFVPNNQITADDYQFSYFFEILPK